MRTRLILILLAASVLLAFGGPGLRGQQGGVQWLQVEGATAVAVGVLWTHGYDDDASREAGLAHVLASCRLANGRRSDAKLLSSGVQVGGDYALAFGVVAAQDRTSAVEFLRGLLREHADLLSDDQLELFAARAALRADDAEHLYPGSVLLHQARQRLAAGTALARPPAGVAASLHGLTASAIRSAFARRVPLRVACLGAVDAEMIQAVEAVPIPGPLAEVRRGAVAAGLRGRSGMSTGSNSRADSPYVAAVFPAPPAEQRAALALGLEVARSRAFRRWRFRGNELHARAPFVGWSWLRGDAFVQFCRRGANQVRLLPGERSQASVEDEVQATTSELRALLEGLRTVPPELSELGRARQTLRRQLLLPGPGEPDPLGSDPATLPGRLQVLLLAAHRALPVAVLDTLTAAEVHAVLQQTLAAERASWHALLPVEVPEFGYRRR